MIVENDAPDTNQGWLLLLSSTVVVFYRKELIYVFSLFTTKIDFFLCMHTWQQPVFC
jgi:hypothetical protein